MKTREFNSLLSFLAMLCIVISISILGCGAENERIALTLDEIKPAEVNILMKIGLESQSEDYQLGNPIGVRTDSSGNIYIADKASLTIKMYDSEGVFVKEIGKRGRGPVEFLDINTFEITPDENFFILDRGNLRYTEISNTGKHIKSQPVDFSMQWQFYPDGVGYYDNKMIALFNDGAGIEVKPLLERELFYIYDRNLENKLDSFFKFKELQDIDISTFAWVTFLGKPGSFTLSQNKRELFYSPLIYHGNIYRFTKNNEKWELIDTIKAFDFAEDAYVEFDESTYNRYASLDIPGLINLRYGGSEPRIGRVNTFDAGIHQLTDGRIIQFVAKWRDLLEKEGEHKNIINIYGQVITPNESVQFIGLVTSIEASQMPWKPLINWKDDNNHFYLLDNTDINYPTVTKFEINGI